jgi:hypothetical protein
MKLEDKVMFAAFGLFGAAIGLLIFMFALGGDSYVFTGTATRSWNGLPALIICCAVGAGLGMLSYRFSHIELGNGQFLFWDAATALLFTKRALAALAALGALYFVWQLAKGL